MSVPTTVDVVMPQMGVSVSEGTVTKWSKNVGDPIAADETLLEISTDKVDTEVPSPGSGTVAEILVQEGETVIVGTVLARIDTAADGRAPASAATVTAQAAPAPANNGHAEHTFVSPVVARISSEHGIDPTRLAGTGRGGRVTKQDILAFIETGAPGEPAAAPAAAVEAVAAVTAPAAPATVTPAAPAPPAPATREGAALEPGETIEPLSPMRRGIAEHMRRSLDTAAHVTSAIEVDMSKVVSIRERLKAEHQTVYGVNPTYLAFIARAAVATLRDWPWVNAEIRGESIVTKSSINLGFAVSLEDGKGLIVPVLKNAESLNLLGMARGIADLAARARSKQLLPDDVQGGTFTITNPGSFGTFMGTPIISRPQTGILGTYAVVKRPWVVQDDLGQDVIAIRPMMNLTLTYDHRLVDGAYGAQFLRDLSGRLQTWGEADY
ncbi:MAG: dihydrolipoamide acetyltransferase family protein [Actinomycetes bacterium]